MQDSASMAATTTFLSGLRVLDLSIWRPGPYATSLLVPLGADVLKVEPPGGDPMRHYAGLFDAVNAGKRSVELNLKEEAGRNRALELAKDADVLVEGFRPGVLARFGLDDAAVRARNPGIVYCSISGYGQHDPRAGLPGHDVNYQAWSGALTPEGGPATAIPPLPTADLAAGLTAAFGICAAVLGRATSGEGIYLDVSMTDVLATWTGAAGAGTGGAAGAPGPPGPTPGYGLFGTSDGGQVALGVVNEQHFWSNLCDELELEDVAALGFDERCRRGAELQSAISGAIATRPRDELVTRLVAVGVPVAPVLDRQGMLAGAPFPPFPIRLQLPGAAQPVPALDQHRGEGFGGPG
jgi:crotonobetainyl-CoA:carnitine CoA-transferase CaiB-like acyl-CoA transferase